MNVGFCFETDIGRTKLTFLSVLSSSPDYQGFVSIAHVPGLFISKPVSHER